MDFIIMHETSKYMRLRVRSGHLTSSEAEILKYVLENRRGVSHVKIYPASGGIAFSYEQGDREQIMQRLSALQFRNVKMFARELDGTINQEEIKRRKLSPEVKARLRRKMVVEAVADILMPMPVQVGYHVYQLVTLRDL